MESFLRFSIVIISGLCLHISVQPASAAQLPGSADSNLNLPAFPFLAEVTGDDVYIRSGPGTQYYNCGKAAKGEKLKVVGNKFSWLQIVPPQGSYSWISKQYVQIDPKDNKIGTVSGDAVRVYAGSDEVQPMHSTSMQVKLNKGDKVTIVGEEKDSYCRIAPPEGAYLWVSSQHAKPLGTLMAPAPAPSAQPETAPPSMPSTAHPMPASPFPSNSGAIKAPASSPNQPDTANVTSTPAPAGVTSAEEQKMKEVQDLKQKVEAERAKPQAEQNYTELKKEIAVIASDKQGFRAARTASALLKMVEKYEFLLEVAKTAKLQDEQAEQVNQKIDAAKNEQLSKIEDKSQYAVIGTLKETPISTEMPGLRYYKIVENDKTLCYARPVDGAAQTDISKFIDKKVGLIGTIEANVDLGEAVVLFTNVVEVP